MQELSSRLLIALFPVCPCGGTPCSCPFSPSCLFPRVHLLPSPSSKGTRVDFSMAPSPHRSAGARFPMATSQA
eukprot:1436071-Pyramimonas_sp.AAC.1